MKVSVILPIYNGEKTLEATLQSLAAQSFQGFELVACIDGTFDGSSEILKKYSTTFNNMIVLQNEINLGLGPTMNRLVANTTGEYIAVAEQDDYYYPNRLQLQVDLLDKKPEIGLVSGIAEFWDGEKVSSKFPGILVHGGQYPKGKEMFLLNYINQTKVVNSCMMFRKTIHVKNGLYFSQHFPNIPLDWAYFLRFCLVSEIFGLNKTLVRLDRSQKRDSITTKKEIHYKANEELLRSFYYEYPNIITKQIFKKALQFQHNIELSSYYGFKFYLFALFSICSNPLNYDFFKIVSTRIKKKSKNLIS